MLRMFIAVGSLLFEVVSLVSEGTVAAAMLVAGTVATTVHVAAESASFQALVNRLTGCDLPDQIEPWPPDRTR